MVFPPGQGKHGEQLMNLWRQYLEQYAEREGSVEDQIVVGGYYTAEIFGSLSLMLDREGRHRALIAERIGYFRETARRAEAFDDCLVNAAFTLYNHLNTLSRQFSGSNQDAERLIQEVETIVGTRTSAATSVGRASAALRAAFPLLGLMTLVLDQGQALTGAIRQVEKRFASGVERATSDWDHLLNALYRLVEMMQLFVFLSGEDLRDQVGQISARFQEEDQATDLRLKLRNGFCRIFELAHLLTLHLDETLSSSMGQGGAGA